MNEKMRKEFEAAITKDRIEAGYDEPCLEVMGWEGSLIYKEVHVQAAWWGWQASRAALVVELPERIDEETGYVEGDEYYNLAIDRCQQAIESAGVRVKA